MGVIGCLIVGYRRPEELLTVLTKVKAEGFDRVLVSVDGCTDSALNVKKENEKTKHAACEFIERNNLDWATYFPEVRLGIVNNFIASIDQAFKDVDYLCVLEDDCVPAQGLLTYFKHVIELSVDNDVQLFTFYRPKIDGLNEGLFITHNPLMWGWGISKLSWSSMKSEFRDGYEFFFPKSIFSLPFQSFYYAGYRSAINKKADALDALIAYYLLKNDYHVVGPPHNLISNIGYGSKATNTLSLSRFMNTPVNEVRIEDADYQIKGGKFQILVNDFLIARKMNDWKFHHLISNLVKIGASKLFSLT